MNILEAERLISDSYCSFSDVLCSVFEKTQDDCIIDLSGSLMTQAILLRMGAYYDSQNRIKQFLNKRYLASASDFFVETVAYYLKLYYHNNSFKIASERQIMRKRGAIRPDISIWDQDTIVATIECKTQLGWDRFNWHNKYEERERKLKLVFPKAKSFLLAMTSLNWSGFCQIQSEHREKFFCLTNDWPSRERPIQFQDRIEKLLEMID